MLGLVGDSSQRPRTSRGGTATITTTMPLTSAYSQRQNISDDMNIYVHQEGKRIKGNLITYVHIQGLSQRSDIFECDFSVKLLNLCDTPYVRFVIL